MNYACRCRRAHITTTTMTSSVVCHQQEKVWVSSEARIIVESARVMDGLTCAGTPPAAPFWASVPIAAYTMTFRKTFYTARGALRDRVGGSRLMAERILLIVILFGVVLLVREGCSG